MSHNLEQQVGQFIAANPEVDEIEVLATDLCGHYFGKRYPIDKLPAFARDGLAFPAGMFVLSTLGEPLDGLFYGIDDGDPDAHFFLVPGSLSLNDWGKRPRAQALATTSDPAGAAFFEPRRVLQRVLETFTGKGWLPTVAFELEFYLFDGQRDDSGGLRLARNPKTGREDSATVLSVARIADFENVIDDIVRACRQQGIETGAISSELGPGQFEINFNHHEDALRAADETCLFKRCVSEIAKQHGFLASFMAKPMLEHAGNGMHMHISVVDQGNNNIFAEADDAHPRLHHAIGGLLDTMPAAMSLWAPNINSYRRYRGGTSCAPVSLTWGYENRTVAFRIPLAKAGAWRVENRVPGADANPYLAMAVTLAAMLHGIENKIDPGEPSEASINERDENLPLSLPEALAATAASEALNHALGNEFVDFYCRHRAAEWQAFLNFTSRREYDWYL